jgi:RNA polymerase sigma factor (sigma-70 family)
MTERTNDEWCAAILRQDDHVWDELSRHLYAWIYNHLSRRLDQLTPAARQELARDCVQDAGVRIVRNVGMYKGHGPFLGWCRVIAVNITRDRMRVERRRLRSESQDLTALEFLIPPELPHAMVDQLFLDELINQIQHIAELKLTNQEQKVFFSLATQESAPSELANKLNVTRNNIDQTWFRARKKVRDHLEQAGYTVEMLRQYRIL